MQHWIFSRKCHHSEFCALRELNNCQSVHLDLYTKQSYNLWEVKRNPKTHPTPDAISEDNSPSGCQAVAKAPLAERPSLIPGIGKRAPCTSVALPDNAASMSDIGAPLLRNTAPMSDIGAAAAARARLRRSATCRQRRAKGSARASCAAKVCAWRFKGGKITTL